MGFAIIFVIPGGEKAGGHGANVIVDLFRNFKESNIGGIVLRIT